MVRMLAVLFVSALVTWAAPVVSASGPDQQKEAAAKEKPVVSARPTINLNTATVAQLEELPGIGRATAERILEYRQKSGGFKKVEELMNVKGIGEKSFLKLRSLVAIPATNDKAKS